jgi:hypothetical protein
MSRPRFSALTLIEFFDQVDPPLRQWLFGDGVQTLVQRRTKPRYQGDLSHGPASCRAQALLELAHTGIPASRGTTPSASK